MDFENMLIDWKTFLVSNDNWHLMRDTSSVIWQLWSFFDKMTKTCRVLCKNILSPEEAASAPWKRRNKTASANISPKAPAAVHQRCLKIRHNSSSSRDFPLDRSPTHWRLRPVVRRLATAGKCRHGRRRPSRSFRRNTVTAWNSGFLELSFSFPFI